MIALSYSTGGYGMDIAKRFWDVGEYAAAGLFEEPDRSLFYRKSLHILMNVNSF